MAKTFNYMERSRGVPEEEAVAILEKEEAEADFTILDDGAWFEDLESIAEGAEQRYQESLKRA